MKKLAILSGLALGVNYSVDHFAGLEADREGMAQPSRLSSGDHLRPLRWPGLPARE